MNDIINSPQYQKALGTVFCEHMEADDNCRSCQEEIEDGTRCEHGPLNNGYKPCSQCAVIALNI